MLRLCGSVKVKMHCLGPAGAAPPLVWSRLLCCSQALPHTVQAPGHAESARMLALGLFLLSRAAGLHVPVP